MNIHLARQPIFDKRKRVFAYELLSRNGTENRYDGSAPDRDTSRMIIQNLHGHGGEDLSGGKFAFINATRDALTQDHLTLLSPERFVIEVLETVEPDAEVVAACQRLKQRGFKIALDDFTDSPEIRPLVQLADFIKVDFMATPRHECARLVRDLRRPNLRFLAEKVETNDDFQAARDLEYSLFQGYFFAKPSAVASNRPVPGMKLNALEILKEFQKGSVNFEKLDQVFRRDPGLSYRILRYINSAHFGLRYKIASIKQAMLFMGEKELRKWISLFAMAALVDDKPAEIFVQALVRAKFCEIVVQKSASLSAIRGLADEGFLLGMFSLLDAMLDRPLAEALNELPIEEAIKSALLGKESSLLNLYACVRAYEAGDWGQCSTLAESLQVDPALLPEFYVEAVGWSDESVQETALVSGDK